MSTASGSSAPLDPDVDDVSVARQLLQYASDTVLGIPEYRVRDTSVLERPLT